MTLLTFFQQDVDRLPLKDGRPTARGIGLYVELYGQQIIREYQDFVGDSLFGVDVSAISHHDMGSTHSMELGYYYPHEIYISQGELFEAYEVEMLNPRRRKQLKDSNNFVKGVMIHELTHAYIFTIAREMRFEDGISINPSFPIEIWTIHSQVSYGSSFIEEGLCEYMSGAMGQIIVPGKSSAPRSTKDIFLEENRYRIQYKYSAEFLGPFLDSTGFKKAVKILLHNPPPSLDELMDPPAYFSRLVIPPQLLGK